MDPYEHMYDAGDGNDATTLVLLHGSGGDAAHFMRMGRMAAPQAALLAVEGNVDEQGVARFYRRVSADEYDLEDLFDRGAALSGFLTDVLSRHGRDPSRAVGVGYTNGANMLAYLLFTRPQLLGGYVLMHPMVPYKPAPNEGIVRKPVLITAGTDDPVATEDNIRNLQSWLEGQGAKVDVMMHDGKRELRDEEVERLSAWLDQLGFVDRARSRAMSTEV
ncbi:alpha/beta hydrolase [Breoghania sp.]|uniref:alpha/beta hydrolase n=1 Tax=Breoghania sp. TaxID=2065378 RepID=UPI002AABA52A|nr:alpha/beta hydrolase [Breoghania sp.]